MYVGIVMVLILCYEGEKDLRIIHVFTEFYSELYKSLNVFCIISFLLTIKVFVVVFLFCLLLLSSIPIDANLFLKIHLFYFI